MYPVKKKKNQTNKNKPPENKICIVFGHLNRKPKAEE